MTGRSAPERSGETGRARVTSPSVAIVHERFLVPAGSERIVEQWHTRWPEAPIFTAICDESSLLPGLTDADIRPTMLQSIYLGHGRYAHTLALIPLAFSRLDLGDPDVVLVSHHAFAQRVRPPDDTVVISYVHTPARWMWDSDLLGDEAGGRLTRIALRAFAASQRRADRKAAERPDVLVANSTAVRDRIRQWWQRDAIVVHPPVDVNRYTPDAATSREDFYLYAGRLVPYKRPEVAIAAARRAGVRIVVAGDGRSRHAAQAASGPGVELLGEVDDATLCDLYRRCRALLHPGIEDFGIVAVEAQACGAPVIARDDGGARDSVVDGVTGNRYRVTSRAHEVGALADAIERFDPTAFDPAALRSHAEQFSRERFVERFDRVVAETLRNRS